MDIFRTYLARFGRYEAIAFIDGFALMAYELVAARLLAPSIGSSIYVWASVIGVILMALSLGYAAGGVLADRRGRPMDVAAILLSCAAGVAATLLAAEGVLQIIVGLTPDPRVQGFLAAMILFMPTSFGLGLLGPYLARLRIVSLDESGRSVALLSALNAIGGIGGTFLVGFVLFGYWGTSDALLFIAALLVGASWLVLPARRRKLRGAASAGVIAAGAAALLLPPAGVLARVDTPTAQYQIIEGAHGNRQVRGLSTGPQGLQSGIYIDGRGDGLAFEYTRRLAEVVERAPAKGDILVLGGGAFTLPAHLARTHPEARIDVVELDPELPRIARQYFGYRDDPQVRIITRDARTYLNATQRGYDIILVDVYSDTSIPFPLTTAEFAAGLKRALKPQGVVAANVVASGRGRCGLFLRGLHGSYLGAFSQSRIYPLYGHSLSETQNILALYAEGSLAPYEDINLTQAKLAPAPAFTDDFAPVERLSRDCR